MPAKQHSTGKQRRRRAIGCEQASSGGQGSSTVACEPPRLVVPLPENAPKFDEEFRSLIPPLADEELAALEASLVREGCRDPLVVWQGHNLLLDGHHRLPVCLKHRIAWPQLELAFASKDEAREWLLAAAFSKRNITTEGAAYVRGQHYNRQKQSHGGDRSSRAKGQSDTLPSTADRLARFYKVDASTIKRDGRFAAAVDAIARVCGDDVKKLMLARGARITRRMVHELRQMDENTLQKVIEELRRTGKLPRPLPGDRSASQTWSAPVEAEALAQAVVKRLRGDQAALLLLRELSCAALAEKEHNEEAPPGGRFRPRKSR
jgi:hypothetical protein